MRLHRLRWEARGQAGVLERAEVVEANRLAARGLQARGLLRLLALELEGRIIATLCAFADRPRPGAWLYYLGAFDPAWRHLGPGSLLVEQAIRRAVREGARRFDFLRGRERYKLLWGARERPTCRRTLKRPDREGPR